MENLLQKYKALSNHCRLRVMYILIQAKTPLCICELIDILHQPQYKISRCLTILKEAQLVEEERDGRLLLHSPQYNPQNKIIFAGFDTIDIKENADLYIDMDNLKERLALREKGKVVITYK